MAIVRPRKVRTSTDVGCFGKTVKPTTRREKWSTTDATHQQNGHCCATVSGNHGTQYPAAVGTRVKSTCHTWSGQLDFTGFVGRFGVSPAVASLPADSPDAPCPGTASAAEVSSTAVSAGAEPSRTVPSACGSGRPCSSMRLTVVTPMCSPALANICPIRFLPNVGCSTLSRQTMYRTKSGNLLTRVLRTR